MRRAGGEPTTLSGSASEPGVHRPQPGVQILDAVEQVQHQGRAFQVHTKITLQV
jgi:hypothetical protein